MTNDIATGADQPRSGNGIKDHSNETTEAPLCAHRKVHFQAKGASTEINWSGGASVPCYNVRLRSKNSANKKVSGDSDNGRSTLSVDKKDETTKAKSTDCFHQTSVDWKATTAENKRSNSDVKKGKKGSKDASSASCSTRDNGGKKVTNQEGERLSFSVDKENKGSKAASSASRSTRDNGDKKVTNQEGELSSFGVGKGKKRSKMASAGCSNQTAASERSGKKRRKETDRKKNSSSSNLRKLITEKSSQKTRTKAKQRKLMELILKADTSFIGQPQLMKADHKPANENGIPPKERSNTNTPLQGTNQETTAVQNVLGGLVNAKRPLPVTPFTVQPDEETMATCEEPLPTTPSVTELVSRMEQLQIASPDESDSESYDDCDGEYDVCPELLSLPEQVLMLMQLLA